MTSWTRLNLYLFCHFFLQLRITASEKLIIITTLSRKYFLKWENPPFRILIQLLQKMNHLNSKKPLKSNKIFHWTAINIYRKSTCISSKYLTFQISLSQQSKIFATMYSFYFKISHKMQWKPLQLNYFIFGNNFFTAVSTFSYMTIMDCLAGSVVLSKTKKDGMKEEEKLPRHLQCHLS